MPTYVWTYHTVDPDLIFEGASRRDLVDDAIDAVPARAWSARDAAVAAAEREAELQYREFTEGDDGAEPFVPLAWEAMEAPYHVPADLPWEGGCELHALNEWLGLHFYVDRMRLDPPLTDGERSLAE